MNEIKAFVGHSFTTDDSEIVGIFLKYFDQVHGLYPQFSWEHAEAAEPRELSEKVLALISEKNLFIGICTKKERSAAPSSLKPALFQPLYRKIKDTDLQWKTSDWIVQEIGLAIGRGLSLILLVEDGLRQPGGLQGNVEYITFRREAPEKSFGKILEMIQSLSPKSAQMGHATADTGAVNSDKTIATDSDKQATVSDASLVAKLNDKDWAHPKPDWSSDDYYNAAFNLIFDDRLTDLDKVSSSYTDTDHAKRDGNRVKWFATTEFYRIAFGKGGDLEKIRKIAAETPNDQTVLTLLGSSLNHYDRHIEAARAFEAAAAVAEGADRQALLGRAAVSRAEGDDTATALSMVDDLRRAASIDPANERDILGALRQVADAMKDDDAAVAILERIVDIAPGEFDARFSLAYKHSEIGNDDMAFHHYLKIPVKERSSLAWNNLGVSFSHFEMPTKSVQSYRRAGELGETLAMSNLGYKFMTAGFLEEAQEQFNRALATKDYHKNITHGLVRLRDIPEEEDRKKEEVLDSVKMKANFYKLLGVAIARPMPAKMGTRWRAPECELSVNFQGNKIQAIGSYEKEVNTGLFALSPNPKSTAKYHIKYDCVIKGRLISGTIQRKREGDGSTPSALTGADTSAKILIVLDDTSILRVMESPHSSTQRY